MGACATKPGDLKVKGGEAPLVKEDAAVAPSPPAAEEKEKNVDEAPAAAAAAVVVAAVEGEPAEAGRRRSLSDLLKEVSNSSVSARFVVRQ
jgi:hypothetical protein